MNDSAAPVRTEPEWPQERRAQPAKVNRPVRAVVAAVELVVAVAAGWGATACWSHVVTTVTVQAADGATLTSRIYSGPWIAAAIGLGLLAALLLVDMIRELILATRTRR